MVVAAAVEGTVVDDATEAAADRGVEAATANAADEARPGHPLGPTRGEGLTRESETKAAAATRSPEDSSKFSSIHFFVSEKQNVLFQFFFCNRISD